MALIYYIGEVAIPEEEANEKNYSGELDKFDKAVRSGNMFNMQMRGGQINSDEFDTPDFHPIGLGKPISVEFSTCYSGDAPKKFLGKKDLLITSGVKSLSTYNAAPKAINQIVKKIEDKTYYQPSAFNQGSPIVYHSPSLAMDTVLCSFNLVADTFNEEIFESVSGLLSKAGGIPVFAPASSILLAGSVISGMIGKLGKVIFESKPFFKGDLNIRLNTPGHIITKSKHVAIIDPRHEKEFKDYVPKTVISGGGNSEIRLVNRNNGDSYNGDAPYVLISIDGRERPELKSFTPTLASASIIESFYGSESHSQTIEVMQEAMELYNDFQYHEKASKQMQKIKDLDKKSEAYLNGKTLLDAYMKNISSDIFKNSLK